MTARSFDKVGPSSCSIKGISNNVIFAEKELKFGLPEDNAFIRAIVYQELGAFHTLMTWVNDEFEEDDWDREHNKLVDDISCSMRFVGTAFEAFLILKALRPLSGHPELDGLTWCFVQLRETRHQHLVRLARSGKVERPIGNMCPARLRPGAGKEDVRFCIVYQPEQLVSECTFLAKEYVCHQGDVEFECEIGSWSELIEVYDEFDDPALIAEFEKVQEFAPFIEKDWKLPTEPAVEPGEVMAKIRARHAMSTVEKYASSFLNRVLT
jgi:hypothetical protein